MNKGRATCEVLKGIRLQIARENCIDYQIDECKYEGNCSGTCPKCEADIRFLERELVKQNKLGKAVVIAGLSVGLLGGITGCDSKKQEKEENSITPINESKSINDSILSKIITKTPQDTFHPKCSSYNNNFVLGSFEGGLELEEYPFRNDFIFDSIVENIVEIEGDIDRPVGLIESMPEFPGNFDSLQNFIKKEVTYPVNCKKDSITGVVLIEFAVEKDGTVTNVKVIQSAHPELDAEAIRVVKSFPKFKPGERLGEPIRTIMQVPIRFTMK